LLPELEPQKTQIRIGMGLLLFYRGGGSPLACQVESSPSAHLLEDGEHRQAVFREGVMDAGRDGFLVVAADDAIFDEFLKVPDEHAFRDFGDALAQFASAFGAVEQAPEDRAFPPAVDDREKCVDGAG
jgi:hypothetical protein